MSIIFSNSSSSILLPMKIILISTTVVSAAVLLKLSVPAIADFAVTDVPSIYNCVVSWLRPPYLYLVINCIIIIIVASSKLQSKLDYHVPPSPSPPPLPQVQFQYPHPEPVVLPLDPIKQHNFDGIVLTSEAVEATKPEDFDYRVPSSKISFDLNPYEGNDLRTGGDDDEKQNEFINVVNDAEADAATNYVNDTSHVISKSSWSQSSTMIRRDSSEYLCSSEKPPASARFGHRRAIKASPEGISCSMHSSKLLFHQQSPQVSSTKTGGSASLGSRVAYQIDRWLE